MSTAQATVTRWARRFVLASAAFLLVWLVGLLAGIPRPAAVVLGLFGFVLHTVFGKAYALVPAYFDRQLAVARAPGLHLPLSTVGVVLLALDALGVAGTAGVPLGTVGAVAWLAGVAVFVGTLAWTVRDNPTGRETGTGDHAAERRPVDRAANAFVPVALAYLAVGSYALLADRAGLPTPVAGLPRIAHLVAAGFAALVLFAVGFRLLPRFLGAHPPRALVAVVLPAGAVGPAALAATLYGDWFPAAAAVEAVAVLGFALAYAVLFARSERRRVGLYGVLAGVTAGTLAALLGLAFAVEGVRAGWVGAHYRLNLLGLLGLSIVGLGYQFYPPTVGDWPGSTDRTAAASLGCLFGGLLANAGGLVAGVDALATAGVALALAGAAAYAYLLAAAVRAGAG